MILLKTCNGQSRNKNVRGNAVKRLRCTRLTSLKWNETVFHLRVLPALGRDTTTAKHLLSTLDYFGHLPEIADHFDH